MIRTKMIIYVEHEDDESFLSLWRKLRETYLLKAIEDCDGSGELRVWLRATEEVQEDEFWPLSGTAIRRKP